MRKKILSGLLAFATAFSILSQVFASDINPLYDTTEYYNNCETAVSGLTLNSGAPDGSSYYTTTTAYSFSGLSANTTDDYMWEMDVRFDAEGAGFTPRNAGDKNYDTCVRRNSNMLAIQTGSSSFTKYISIDGNTWYHIQLIGQYGTSSAVDMVVYKWNSGVMEYVATYTNVNKRNNVAANHFYIEAGTSIDNLKITNIGADTLTLSAVSSEILAGESLTISLAATRQSKTVNTPAVAWSVYDENNQNLINDGTVSIDSNGVLTAAAGCPTRKVTVRATSTEKGNVVGTYSVSIKAVDTSSEKYDTLILSSDRDYVRVDEPLSINVAATKNGEAVQLEDSDVNWVVYDENNLRVLGNKYITVTNGVVSVDKRVISQKITVRATNASGTIKSSIPVTVKAADALESGESGDKDILNYANACENTTSGVTLSYGSWDGSAYYYSGSSSYHFDGLSANTTEDLLVEADIRFDTEGSGFQLYSKDNGKLGLQVTSKSGSLGIVKDSSSTPVYLAINSTSWYHIEIMARCGNGDSSYANLIVYKYDENGNRVHPTTGAADTPFVQLGVPMRNLSAYSPNHVCLSAGTSCDNIRMLKPVPDELSVSVDAQSIYAGNTVQATCTATRKGIQIPNIGSGSIEWAVYDSDNKYPLDNKNITISSTGLLTVGAMALPQNVYIRVSTVSGSLYASAKVTILASDIFSVDAIGLDENNTEILQLDVTKLNDYADEVTFIVAVYNDSGIMTGIYFKKMYGDSFVLNETTQINVSFLLPDGFNSNTDTIKVFTWTLLN
ncbi:MAG: hypothetical protein N2171_04310 [Clostridia bacterium]|nr:hypothetical protein [Clostridia bacterium]